MRLLADESFPKPVVQMLRGNKEFWQIAVQRRVPLDQAGIVLFWVHPAIPKRLEPLIRTFLAAEQVSAGHVNIVSASGIQMVSFRRN